MTNKLSVILAISILMNVFLLGFVFSSALKPDIRKLNYDMRPPFAMNNDHDMDRDHFSPPPERPENMMARVFEEKARNLPPEERAQVLDVIKKYKNDTGNDFEELAPIFESLQKEYIADQLDENKITSLRQQLGELDLENKQKMGDMITEIAKKMSPQGRKEFFKDLLPPPHRRPEKN